MLYVLHVSVDDSLRYGLRTSVEIIKYNYSNIYCNKHIVKVWKIKSTNKIY